MVNTPVSDELKNAIQVGLEEVQRLVVESWVRIRKASAS